MLKNFRKLVNINFGDDIDKRLQVTFLVTLYM